ncbi:hypothetical protein BN2497_13873 [Janthinobacterium sp. CG23_2]|nr:hypothetical protein BN2497_13873 [Janthinobacterium sp. CG23_2]CUU33334.1 hypothetical protein BN3177_13873 [Janthinobacterium sp. CG23_2]
MAVLTASMRRAGRDGRVGKYGDTSALLIESPFSTSADPHATL